MSIFGNPIVVNGLALVAGEFVGKIVATFPEMFQLARDPVGSLGVGTGAGFGFVAATLLFLFISGAHIDPLYTLAKWLAWRIGFDNDRQYVGKPTFLADSLWAVVAIVCQFVGALAAGGLVALVDVNQSAGGPNKWGAVTPTGRYNDSAHSGQLFAMVLLMSFTWQYLHLIAVHSWSRWSKTVSVLMVIGAGLGLYLITAMLVNSGANGAVDLFRYAATAIITGRHRHAWTYVVGPLVAFIPSFLMYWLTLVLLKAKAHNFASRGAFEPFVPPQLPMLRMDVPQISGVTSLRNTQGMPTPAGASAAADASVGCEYGTMPMHPAYKMH